MSLVNQAPQGAAQEAQQMANVHEGYIVIVWFATSSSPRGIGTYSTLAAAEKEARRYLGADARGYGLSIPTVRER